MTQGTVAAPKIRTIETFVGSKRQILVFPKPGAGPQVLDTEEVGKDRPARRPCAVEMTSYFLRPPMRSLFQQCAVPLVLVFLSSGCAGGDPGTRDMIAGMTEAVDAMRIIKDKTSAKRAQSKLQAAAAKYVAGTEKVNEVTAERRQQLAEIGKKVQEEIARVQRVPGGNDSLAVFVTPVSEANLKLAAKRAKQARSASDGTGGPVAGAPGL